MATAARISGTMRLFDPAAELSDDVRTRFFIDGAWVAPRGQERFDIVSPVTEEVTLDVPLAGPVDMEAAIASARRAFDTGAWPRLTPGERAIYLRRIAEQIDRRQDLFKRVWTGQVGVPQWFVDAIVGAAAQQFRYYADQADTFPFEEERTPAHGRLKVVREPVGVAALVTPWNAPLVLLVQKMSAALMAGCTVVAKPSPETPLDALILAECVAAAGVPAGVVNVVPGGREVGDLLIRDTRIDKVSFTGSTAAGRHIASVCGERLARVGMELGGKSATILCDDADIGLWMQTLSPFTMPFSGQICFAQTRILVPRSRHADFLEAYVSATEAIRLGDPADPQVQMGPVSIARQRDRVLDYIGIGRDEGARIVTGGGASPLFDRGYFITPTIFDRVTADMRIAQEEIFGPVVSVIPYDGDEEAVAIANNSDFGLSGSVFSVDVDRAERIARRVRTGHISINGFNLDSAAPFGGFKQSGIGRESGPEGLASFLETKSLFLPA